MSRYKASDHIPELIFLGVVALAVIILYLTTGL